MQPGLDAPALLPTEATLLPCACAARRHSLSPRGVAPLAASSLTLTGTYAEAASMSGGFLAAAGPALYRPTSVAASTSR